MTNIEFEARCIYPKSGHMFLPFGLSIDEPSLYKVAELLSSIPIQLNNLGVSDGKKC